MYLQNNTYLQGGRYQIVRHISSGGFGNTYEGLHVMLDKRVAIKEFFVKDFCNRDETTMQVTTGITSKIALVDKLRKKFIDEARSLCKLEHPHIVHVYDVFEENGTAYYVMDFIDGPSLNDIVKKEGRLSEERALKYIRQVADALKYVHDHNRLHLDIKPGNIMIDAHDNAFLIDFGSSKQYDEVDGENTSTLLGYTPGYAPTEQIGKRVQNFIPATDIYALGATLYKLLSGSTPPDSSDIASGEDLGSLPSSVSTSVKNAIIKAMAINKDNRPQNIAEFLYLIDTKIKSKRSKKYLKFLFSTIVISLFCIYGYFYIDSSNSFSDILNNRERSFLVNGVLFKMIRVKGGDFTMGATPRQYKVYTPDQDEEPAHRVTLSDYYIGETVVTQALWYAVMNSSPSAKYKWESKWGLGANYPAYRISYDDCLEFIKNLNLITGENFRMLTEAEWEYAARGGEYNNDYWFSGSNNLDSVAWHNKNSNNSTHPVALLKPNELGIYDMTGNIWEWCSDWKDNYSNEQQVNPKGPSFGTERVCRGGSWTSITKCRVATRDSKTPGTLGRDLGLRLAL